MTAQPIFKPGDPVPTHYSVPSRVTDDLIFYVGALPTIVDPPSGVDPVVFLGKLKRIPKPGDPGNLFGIWAGRAIKKSELKKVSTDALAMWQTMWPDSTTNTKRDTIRYGMNWSKDALVEG